MISETNSNFIKDIFNSIARSYDITNTIMTLGLDKRWRSLAVEHSELKRGCIALDVCCGSGMLAIELARVASDAGKVTGIDFSENMLAVARQNIDKLNLNNIDLINANAECLPFADNSFDCVTVGWGLRNIPDALCAIKEMIRVLKPGGKIVSLDMGQPEFPVFRHIYWLFFKNIIPLIGLIFTRNKQAYKYFHNSAKLFLSQRELADMFKSAGLSEAKYVNFLGGAVALVEGKKPQS